MPEVELKPCFLAPTRVQPQRPLFVYLPGMDGTGKLLRSQTVGLEVGFDVRCLAIPRQDLSCWDILSNTVLELIHEELEKNSDRKIYLCGESFGGCLAMKVAIKAPQLFEGIVLINPASSFQLLPWLNWASQITQWVHPCLYDLGALLLLPFLASLPRISQSDRQELLKTMRSVPPETVIWRLSLIKEFHVDEEKLRELTQPSLLIGSASDQLLPSVSEVSRLANILPNAQTLVLPYSGHACLLEKDINLYQIMAKYDFLDHSIAKVKELV